MFGCFKSLLVNRIMSRKRQTHFPLWMRNRNLWFPAIPQQKEKLFLTINICLFDEFNLLRSKIFHTKCQNGWVLKWRRMKKMWEWRAAFNLIESLDFFSKNDMNQNRMNESKGMKKIFFCFVCSGLLLRWEIKLFVMQIGQSSRQYAI